MNEPNLDVGEVRIEGHASREWIGARAPDDAFLDNLGLSQDRAQAVLAGCLGLVAGTDIGKECALF